MSNSKAIEIILRIRPTQVRSDGVKSDAQNGQVSFNVPKDQAQGIINNQKQLTKFQFDRIFQADTSQQKMFDKVGKDIVESAIEGFSGTIFAYGQTGSGKTYTMTGGDTLQSKGLMPRTLNHIFFLQETKGLDLKIRIRYLQIYNGVGYDLLDPSIDSESLDKRKSLQQLARVRPMQTEDGSLKLENLSTHLAKTLQDAMDLLYIGDTNRVVCQTEKNDQSTRSHCIFMIVIQTSKPGTDVKTVATINLVDLSGSQRIKHSQYDHTVEREAISINLGLHYLERLIVALNDQMKGLKVHVPYRQSLLNLILKNSIGGNCITRMIATVNPMGNSIGQSMSTCKFAQRVAQIKNNVLRNQTVDPAVIIARLKKQNAQLKAQLAILKGQDVKQQLDKWQIQDCRKAVQQYIQSQDPSASLIMSDRLKINQCFYFFKSIIKKGGMKISNVSSANSENKNASNMQSAKGGSISSADQQRYEDEIKKLKLALQSRDNQITLLLSLINKKRGGANSVQSIPVNRIKQQDQQMIKSVVKEKPIQFQEQKQQKRIQQQDARSQFSQISSIKAKNNNWVGDNSKVQNKSMAKNGNLSGIQAKQIENMLLKPLNLTNQDLLDQVKAFQKFRVSTRRHQAMLKNDQVLRQKMRIGKQIAHTVGQSRQKIGKLKTRLQQIQRQNAVKNLVDGIDRVDPEQDQIRDEITKTKQIYKDSSQKLKGIKLQIQNIQIIQKKNVQQLKNDYLKYLQFKQQQRQTTMASVDSSILASNIKDKEVQKHLQSFLKARDQLRKR